MTDGTGQEPGSPTERLLALIGEHHDSVRDALDDEQYALLRARLEALAGTATQDRRAVAKAFRGVQLALMPLPLGHPVLAATESPRLVAAPPGPAAVTQARDLMALLAFPRARRSPSTAVRRRRTGPCSVPPRCRATRRGPAAAAPRPPS